MDLSVIISTWNNAIRLEETLRGLIECSIPEHVVWELVLVNNNSTDNTAEVAHSFSYKLPIKYIEEPVQGLARARNTGIKHATGTLIIFTDDDVTPCKEWLTTYWDAFLAHREGFAFGGPVFSIFEGKQPTEQLRKFLPISVNGLDYGNEEMVINDSRMFISANWGCTKKAIEEAGAFDESLGLNPDRNDVRVGEETDLMVRLRSKGVKLLYLPKAKIGHHVPESKCTLEHAIERQYGTAYYLAKSDLDATGEKKHHVPLWVLRRYVKDLAWYMLRFLTPRNKRLSLLFKFTRSRAVMAAYRGK
jgi:glycosyltransferase involved in cell wall biosynthesis